MSVALHYSFRKIDNQTSCDIESIQPENVDQIYLKFCDLSSFPEWLPSLQNLTHIQISNNSIDRVPAELGSVSNLQYLDMSDNRLFDFPPVLSRLSNLRYLDLSGNFIETIPTDVKNLKSLEFLKFDRNFITEIPNELAECVNIIQMSFEQCARLFSIPRHLLNMPNLEHVSFRGCNLITVPSIVSSKIRNLLLNGNSLLNCIPHDVIKFIDPDTNTSEFYMVESQDLTEMLSSQANFIHNSPEIKHIQVPNGFLVNIPNEVEKVFTRSSIEIPSLKELSYRAVIFHEGNALPKQLSSILKYPTAICTCSANIFVEVFMTLFYDKHRADLEILATKFFCSKKCLSLFYESNKDDLVFIA